MTRAMTTVEAESLTLRYGARAALSDLDLRIPSGVVGLLGRNGAGKSTLLKTILGWLVPARGTIRVLDRPVSSSSTELRLRLGYFPERSVVVPDASAVDAVTLAGELGGLERGDALARAHDMLWFTGLGDVRYRPMENFSTGMLQRTKLAMALVHDPELVLLDEPTSGLDPAGRRHMLELIAEIGARGVSVLLSTHLLHDVEQVCENVVVLDRGCLVLEGRIDALRGDGGETYEIRVREESPGAFATALSERGLSATEGKDGAVHVFTGAPGTRPLFEAARAAKAEVRHLRRVERSLEERFLGAVGGPERTS